MLIAQIVGIAALMFAAVYIANGDRGIPLVTIILGVFLAFWTFVASKTRFGRHVYALSLIHI